MKKAAIIMVLVLLAATLLTACSDNKSAAVGGSAPVISAVGGEGTVGNGGGGGSFDVYPYDNTTVKISRTGSVDTSVDSAFFDNVLSSASFTTGAVPMNVTTNTTVKTYPTNTATNVPDDSLVAAGEFHTHGPSVNLYIDNCGAGNNYVNSNNNVTLYRRNDANDADEVVTGIHVSPGVTLTFQPNYTNWSGCIGAGTDITAGLEYVGIWGSITNSIWNQGTITVMDYVTGANEVGNTYRTPIGSALDKVGLDLETNSVFLNDGTIVTKGTDTTLTTGGNGGWIYLWANAAIVNRGTIDSSGGNGTDGGYAGNPTIDTNYGIWNSGPINAKGGTGTAGVGGYGARISFNTYDWQSLLYNSGTLNSSGGDGTAGGGDASGSTLYAGQSWGYACGAFVNSGNLIGNGGNATTDGNGGTGANWWNADAPHDLGAYGCNLLNSGAIEFKGGAGKGAGSSGGGGGELYVYTGVNWDYGSNNLVAPGSIQFGGSVNADGGAGESGGGGGHMELYNDVYMDPLNWYSDYVYPTNSGSIEVLGFSNVNLRGGKGATDGGSGGYSELYWDISNYNDTNVDWNGNFFIVTPSSIYNDTDFDLTGGQGLAGNGGSGGAFYAELRSDYLFWNWWKPGAKSTPVMPGSIENRGNITTKGGQGVFNGGNAGYRYYYYSNGYSYYDDDISIFMFASGNIINTGALNASGGNATDVTGNGGYGYPVVLDAIGNTLNSGSVNVSGGNGPANGADASWVDVFSYAGTCVNTAAITANGGNANTVDGYGGGGGYIYIANYSYGPIAAYNTGTLSVVHGTGADFNGDGGSYVGYD